MRVRALLPMCVILAILGAEYPMLAGENTPTARKKAQLVLGDGDAVRVEYSPVSAGSRSPGQRLNPEVWSPGTGQATIFTTAANLAIADSKLPPGQYSLYLQPSGDGWILIINQQVGQAASSYPEGWDIVHAPMKKRELSTPVSLLTFSLQRQGLKGGTLKLSFGKTEVSVPFEEAPPEEGMPDSS